MPTVHLAVSRPLPLMAFRQAFSFCRSLCLSRAGAPEGCGHDAK
jgi:hypothetical protein